MVNSKGQTPAQIVKTCIEIENHTARYCLVPVDGNGSSLVLTARRRPTQDSRYYPMASCTVCPEGPFLVGHG